MNETKSQEQQSTALEPREGAVRYLPVGAEQEIKLSAKMVQTYLCKPTNKGHVCSERDAQKFVMLCLAKGLNPWENDAWLVGYDSNDGPEFSLITAHQALLKRAEINPNYDGMESGVIVKSEAGLVERQGDFYDGEAEERVVGGWAKVYRKDQAKPTYERLRLASMRKNSPFWRDNPEGQIVKCFDEDTEVLTTRGFEKFANAEGRILQVAGDGRLIPTESVPFSRQYAGPMVAFDSQHLDFVVTPNHEMITTDGNMEAKEMFNRPQRLPVRIPRCHANQQADTPLFTDEQLRLAAVFITDGYFHSSAINVSVSRHHKIEMLDQLGLHYSRSIRECAGDTTETDTRVITTLSNKVVYRYKPSLVSGLVNMVKESNPTAILALSARQARVFVDTMIACDGSTMTNGVRRFYASRPEVVRAFELAAICAGYSISGRTARTSDISSKPNYCITVSRKESIPVNLSADKRRPRLSMIPNPTSKVWCVTVPSHVIIVRRRGFSFICGNCAEAAALRRSFPTKCGGLFLQGEIEPGTEAAFQRAKPANATTKWSLDQLRETVGNGGASRPESATSGPEPRQTQPEEPRQTQPEATPQEKLKVFCEGEGFTFEVFSLWSHGTGNQPEGADWKSFEEVPDDLAKRFLKSKDGLKKGLAGAKGVVTQ
jgi:hypothetical protein